MRRIVAGFFQSLDGVVQSPGAPDEDRDGGFASGGWVMPHFDETVGGFIDEIFAGPFDLLLGRRTYDIFAGHWPKMSGEPLADGINRAVKFVVTSREPETGWAGTRRLRDFDEIAAAKASEGPDILVQGSSTLYPELLRRRLIDRLFLVTFPIVLGRGKRALDGAPPLGLTLVDTRIAPSGVVITVFERPGDLKIEAVPTA